MKFIKNFPLDDLYLFEIAILGECKLINDWRNNFLIIPCYRPDLHHLDEKGRIVKNAFLIFEGISHLSVHMQYYKDNGKDFSGYFTRNTFNTSVKLSSKKGELNNIGKFVGGLGWLSYDVLYNKFHLLYDKIDEVGEDFYNTDVDFALSNLEILNHLLYPNLNKVTSILMENELLNR